jgi:hypothetical protein
MTGKLLKPEPQRTDGVAYRAPALVHLVVGEVVKVYGEADAYEQLAYGIEVDRLYALIASQPFDPCQVLHALITSGDFTLLPRLRVRAVRPRFGSLLANTHLQNIDGVWLYTDTTVESGDRVLMRLAPSAVDARSALRFALLDNPDISRTDAFARVRRMCPHASLRSLDRDWPAARLDVGLSAMAKRGRPRKAPADISQ